MVLQAFPSSATRGCFLPVSMTRPTSATAGDRSRVSTSAPSIHPEPGITLHGPVGVPIIDNPCRILAGVHDQAAGAPLLKIARGYPPARYRYIRRRGITLHGPVGVPVIGNPWMLPAGVYDQATSATAGDRSRVSTSAPSIHPEPGITLHGPVGVPVIGNPWRIPAGVHDQATGAPIAEDRSRVSTCALSIRPAPGITLHGPVGVPIIDNPCRILAGVSMTRRPARHC